MLPLTHSSTHKDTNRVVFLAPKYKWHFAYRYEFTFIKFAIQCWHIKLKMHLKITNKKYKVIKGYNHTTWKVFLFGTLWTVCTFIGTDTVKHRWIYCIYCRCHLANRDHCGNKILSLDFFQCFYPWWQVWWQPVFTIWFTIWFTCTFFTE